MNPEAGRAVIAAFEKRGNDMPIDLRHGMLAENPTLAQSEAYGWIPCPGGLEYVDGDGLYARRVQWDPQVKAALQAKPPRIKYFSPTYDVDPKTRVVVGLTNIALTNLPATHGLNRLAAERGRRMDLAQLGKLLTMLMQKADAGESEAAAMRDMLITALGDQVETALAAANGGEIEAEDDIVAGMSEDDKKVYATMSEPMKAMYRAGIKASKVAAEDDKAKVAAEEPAPDSKKSVAASISAEQILLMADAEVAKQAAPRQKIVAELVTNKRIAKGGEVEKLLLDPSLSEETFTKVVAARKTVSVTMGKAPVPPVPTTKGNGVTIAAEQKVNKLADAFGVDPKAVLERLRNQGKR